MKSTSSGSNSTGSNSTNQQPLPGQTLEGVLERITYHNEENGYTVARVIPRGRSAEVTVVGKMTGINVGETLRMIGQWTTHPQYGRQFEIQSFTVQYPSTVDGIRKYLASGLIPGVGPVTATRIVDTFGIETLNIIENEPERLKEVPGIGGKRIDQISAAWEQQKQIKEIMVFLQSLDISTSMAVRIYREYGQSAFEIIHADPFRLAKDIFGIGFKTADKIARHLGMSPDAPARIRAGIVHALSAFTNDGHCFTESDPLITEASRLLEVPASLCYTQLDELIDQKELISEEGAIYLPAFLHAERGVARKLRQMQSSTRDRCAAFLSFNWDWAFSWLDQTGDIHLTDQQKAAVRMSLTKKISVLTGGPGTGKSTITASIIRLLNTRNASVLLAAPTGRAAKRLNETTGITAKTIHRLLEYSPSGRSSFSRDGENPLDADLIIIDETSMVDILLMYHLLNAIEDGSHLLLVGDMDQLPSVGPGNVLRDLIASEQIPVTRLETIFRQAEDSFIIENAHRINQGQMPVFSSNSSDFFLFPAEEPEKAAEWVFDLVTERIPRKFGVTPTEDVQVLSPMYRGAAGVSELNIGLQAKLNPPAFNKPEYGHGSRTFRQGDRVMQIHNDYERMVFNGDQGRISRIDLEEHIITVVFDGRDVNYEYAQLDELVHAYAISIHKSQGSEYPIVIIPLLTHHYRMLQRNLLYTAVTRAKKVVILVGNQKAIGRAVSNNKIAQRNTRLSARLKGIYTTDPPAQTFLDTLFDF